MNTPTSRKLPLPTWLIITLLSVVLIGVAWLLRPRAEVSSYQAAPLPWHIETFADGSSRVFQLHLGAIDVAQLLAQLGEDHELAIISNQQDQSGLEIYYGDFQAGPIKGKLIARVEATQEQLEAMQARASNSSYTDSGSRKFLLNPDDLQQIQSWPIAGLSFTPAANLSEAVITARFGTPTKRLITGRDEEAVIHFLYPEKGVHIALSESSKELLQYIAPRDFTTLSAPLMQASEAESAD